MFTTRFSKTFQSNRNVMNLNIVFILQKHAISSMLFYQVFLRGFYVHWEPSLYRGSYIMLVQKGYKVHVIFIIDFFLFTLRTLSPCTPPVFLSPRSDTTLIPTSLLGKSPREILISLLHGLECTVGKMQI